MRQFSAKIRLNGSLFNEVPKSDLTIPQIIVLRVIHGNDSVLEIEEVAPVTRSASEERDRLQALYGEAIANRGVVGGIGALIGFAGEVPDAAPGVPLPEAAKQARVAKVKRTEPEPTPEPEPELALEG